MIVSTEGIREGRVEGEAFGVNDGTAVGSGDGTALGIDVGVNDGVIETTAGDLRLFGAGEMFLDDGNQAHRASSGIVAGSS